MRKLFEIDAKNYDINGKKFIRPSARGIIVKNHKIAVVYSQKYNYYKLPGGGINANESKIEALIREVKEETGLVVKKDSIKEYGYVHRIQKGHKEDVFIQDNYYYLCDVETQVLSQKLDDYEANERFTLEFVDPYVAIDINRNFDHGPKDKIMIEREAKIFEMLLEEKLI